jgi:hypothetical protein
LEISPNVKTKKKKLNRDGKIILLKKHFNGITMEKIVGRNNTRDKRNGVFGGI